MQKAHSFDYGIQGTVSKLNISSIIALYVGVRIVSGLTDDKFMSKVVSKVC